MDKRLKAFTILELLVAMGISGLVISIAGLAYNMSEKQFNDYRKINNSIASVFALDTRIKTDFFDAREITRKDEGLIIQRRGRDEVGYRFTGKYALRVEADRTDTFYIETGPLKLLFKREEAGSEETVDELYFEAKVLGVAEVFHYLKDYGAEKAVNNMKKDQTWR